MGLECREFEVAMPQGCSRPDEREALASAADLSRQGAPARTILAPDMPRCR